MDVYKSYRELYLRYSQRHLRTRKKEVESRIAELEKIKRKYKARQYKGMWKEERMRSYFLKNCRELEQFQIELNVLEELIKPRVINWKVCVAMFSIGFILYNGYETKMNNFGENRTATTSMHGSEEDDDKLENPEKNFSLEDILKEIKEDWEENYVPFTNPKEAIR